MDPNQNLEGQELAKRVAPLRRQLTSLVFPPIPPNITLTQLGQELNPIGLTDPLGNLVSLQFQCDMPRTSDITTSSSVCTGAVIYKGPYQDAVARVNRHQGSYYVLKTNNHQHWSLTRPPGWRAVWLTLRFVSSVNEKAKPVPELTGDDGDFVLILLPQGANLLPNQHPSLPFIGPRPRLVMEGMLVGRSYVEASEICQF
ncbi:hypothetical protein FPHYL_3963 [Fusarium phyllophilum]|uniref:Uncharacterized protein n=1 Tax=Fusarium phyllophilum TaxID=47803 RepID=A0A8H5NJ19_9HYPO|nr:hypothetical protein FPHYL_3963 [Fusarium phyllophilum]